MQTGWIVSYILDDKEKQATYYEFNSCLNGNSAKYITKNINKDEHIVTDIFCKL